MQVGSVSPLAWEATMSHTIVRPAVTQETDRHTPALGLRQSTALVVGSIIGVGIFSLPYSLASYGPISILALGLATVGAAALALMFGVMSRRVPAEGGHTCSVLAKSATASPRPIGM